MGFTKFFNSLNPFSTTRRKKHRTRRQRKHKRTRRNIMRGGWGELVSSSDKYVMKGGWGGALPAVNNL